VRSPIKAAEKAFIIIDDTIEIEGKTKAAAELLKNVGATGKVLLINDDNKSLLLATPQLTKRPKRWSRQCRRL